MASARNRSDLLYHTTDDCRHFPSDPDERRLEVLEDDDDWRECSYCESGDPGTKPSFNIYQVAQDHDPEPFDEEPIEWVWTAPGDNRDQHGAEYHATLDCPHTPDDAIKRERAKLSSPDRAESWEWQGCPACTDDRPDADAENAEEAVSG
mgnify:CR=1 FL=1